MRFVPEESLVLTPVMERVVLLLSALMRSVFKVLRKLIFYELPFFQNTDQFYAVGLVGYGFGCEDAIPAVYTNLVNSEVKRFIESAFSRNFC